MSPTRTPALFSGLADELSSMIPVVEGLSAIVFDYALKAGPEDRPQILTRAQAVDDLGQRLEAIRDLCGQRWAAAPRTRRRMRTETPATWCCSTRS